ncbi:hypothetical protein [Kitasatospora sp. NBC_00240]|uniref:hypothetical protein n=1 Tax=Kitasatospora sp. NBC_00240 TaxID=2903567 RepID=UPI00224D9AC7|nr:hypothetical protein [Kitasatospora sp. NBC_00240]
MLKSIGRLTIRVMLAAGLLLTPAGPAWAEGPDGDVHQCEVTTICTDVHEPGTAPKPGTTGGTGTNNGGGGVQTCTWNGEQWPCWDNDLGWFDSSNGCYYHRSSPQPPAGSKDWDGHDPADGAVYEVNCRQAGGGMMTQNPVFLAQAPGGPPPDNPATLAKDARDRIVFTAPQPHIAPADKALVGLPVWLWYDWSGAGKAPQPVTVKGNYISVTATPSVHRVIWDLGDGHTVQCKGPGTPYPPGATGPSPDCPYLFTASSALKANGTFSVTVTVEWQTDSVIVGAGTKVGQPILLSTTSAPFELKVGEVQVLN